MRNERGAATVFVILIIVPLFIFQAVLIEYARSRLADQQLESAVKAALRSVGAMYDVHLQAYGLYGADVQEAQIIYEQVVKENLGHGFANTSYVSSSLTMERSLADPDVFLNQVMEEMKYRAPLEYMRQITSRLQKTGIGNAMKDMSSFSKQAGEMERLAAKRDEAMEQAWERFSEWDVWIAGSLEALRQQIGKLEPNHSAMRSMDTAALLREKEILAEEMRTLTQQEEQSESDERRIQEIEASLLENEQKMQRYHQWLGELRSIEQRFQSIEYQVSSLADSVLAALNEAESNNEKLRESMEGWQSDFGYELIRSVELKNADDYNTVRDRVVHYEQRLASLGADFAQLPNTRAELLADELGSYIASWAGWMKQVQTAQLEQAAKDAQQREEQGKAERAFEEQIEKVLRMITGCASDREEQEREIYARLKEKTSREEQGEGERTESYTEGRDAEEDALSMSQMIGQLSDQLIESLYVNEYALISFNYRTLGSEHLQIGDTTSPLTYPEAHPLQRQEVEYILYGFHSCAANYSAAYWEIFSFRLAVRTLESLMDPKNSWKLLGSPLLAFLWALAEGAVQAYQDVVKLKDGHETAISSKLAPSVTWNYKDYLRLFLLLHGGKEERIRRMQALIELNTGQELSAHYTYWRTTTEGEQQPIFVGRYTYHPKVEAAWGYY